MATVRKRGNTYQIRVSAGYDSKGNQIIKSKTWKPSPTMTERQIKKELETQTVLFEQQVQNGQFLDGKITLTATKPPHMRGIKQAIEEIKQADPYTALTEPALRRLIISKEVPSVRVGTKYLINMDILNNYLCGGTTESEPITAAGIKKVSE